MDAVHVRFGTPSTFSRFGRSIDCKTAFGLYTRGTKFVSNGKILHFDGRQEPRKEIDCVKGNYSYHRYNRYKGGEIFEAEGKLLQDFDEMIMAIMDNILVNWRGDDLFNSKELCLCANRDVRSLLKKYFDQIARKLVIHTKYNNWNIRGGLYNLLKACQIHDSAYDRAYDYLMRSPEGNYIINLFRWEESVLSSYFSDDDWEVIRHKASYIYEINSILENILFKMCEDVFMGLGQTNTWDERDINVEDVIRGIYLGIGSSGIIRNLVYYTSSKEDQIRLRLSQT